MTTTFVLRLVEAALDEGHIAGTAEVVETGEVGTVCDIGDLVSFLLAGRSSGSTSPSQD